MIEALWMRGGWVFVAIGLASMAAWVLGVLAWFQVREDERVDWRAVDAGIGSMAAGTQDRSLSERIQPGWGVVGELMQRLNDSRSTLRNRLSDRQAFRMHSEALIGSRWAMHEDRLHQIAVLASIMPLLGLLGTLAGIMQSFESLAALSSTRAGEMANGISHALVTTQAGLAATLPVVLAHRWLRSKLRRSRNAIELRVQRLETLVCCEEGE